MSTTVEETIFAKEREYVSQFVDTRDMDNIAVDKLFDKYALASYKNSEWYKGQAS